ncbi:hypothetical protein HK405_006357, partial [Cladochytrium tenue]
TSRKLQNSFAPLAVPVGAGTLTTSVDLLAPSIRRLRVPSRGAATMSSSPIPFADVRSLDEEASIRGIATRSILSDAGAAANAPLSPPITSARLYAPSAVSYAATTGPDGPTSGATTAVIASGPRLDDIESALDGLRASAHRRHSFVGSIGSSAWIGASGGAPSALLPDVASSVLYLDPETRTQASGPSPPCHLVVLVHGLLGSAFDLRQYRNRVAFWRHWVGAPESAVEFLVSHANEDDTFADIEVLADRLVDEILAFVDQQALLVDRLSFVCHSLGGLIARCAITKPAMEPFWSKMHTFTSLSAPHLSLNFHNNPLLNSFLGIYQLLERSPCIDQLYMRDNADPRATLLFRLVDSPDSSPGLGLFRHVRLLASAQDGYVPLRSALVAPPGSPAAAALDPCLPPGFAADLRRHNNHHGRNHGHTLHGLGLVSPRQPPQNNPAALADGDDQVAAYALMAENFNAAAAAGGSGGSRPAVVERFLVAFGSVAHAPGWDPVKRKAHVAMLEDPAFLDLLVLINKLHL